MFSAAGYVDANDGRLVDGDAGVEAAVTEVSSEGKAAVVEVEYAGAMEVHDECGVL